MDLLTTVNLILAKLGEHQVTRLDATHPTVSIILPEVEHTKRQLLTRGWWFNTFQTKLYPGPDGSIAVGADILEFIPDVRDSAVLRGARLFNPANLDFTFDAEVSGVAYLDVAHDGLPEQAQDFIYYDSLVTCFVADIGPSAEVDVWNARRSYAFEELHRAHLRHRRYNTKDRPQYRKIIGAMRG